MYTMYFVSSLKNCRIVKLSIERAISRVIESTTSLILMIVIEVGISHFLHVQL